MLTGILTFHFGMIFVGLVFLGPMAIQEQKEINQDLLEYYVPLLQDFIAEFYAYPVNEFVNYEFSIWEFIDWMNARRNEYGYEYEEIEKVLNILSKYPIYHALNVDKEFTGNYSVSSHFSYGRIIDNRADD